MAALLEPLPHALMITGLVFIMMVLIEYINVQNRGWWQERLRESGWKQHAIASGLGAVPGYLGAFTVVSLITEPSLRKLLPFLVGVVTSGRRVGFEPYLLAMAPEDRRKKEPTTSIPT